MAKSKDDKKKVIIDFKKYLNKDNPLTGKLYFGNIDHEVNEGFEAAVKLLEKKISKAINRSIEGQLWKSSGFNYDASVDDLNKSINLIAKAQATLDAIGPYEAEPTPTAVNFQNTPPGYLPEADPVKTQQQGVLKHEVPEDILNDYSELSQVDTNQDERFLEFQKLMVSKNK